MSTNTGILRNNPQLIINQIKDGYTRSNFQSLSDYFAANNQLLGFQFYEVVFTKAVSNYLVAHGLGFVPLDILVTQVTGSGVVTFNYGLFDKTNINLTTTGACRVRFLAGTYYNFQSAVNPATTDKWVVNPATTSSSSTSTSANSAITEQHARFTGGVTSFGSVNTGCWVWGAITINLGSSITPVLSPTLGSYFLINTTGIYSIFLSARTSVAGGMWVMKNVPAASSVAPVETDPNLIGYSFANAITWAVPIHNTVFLKAGDKVFSGQDSGGVNNGLRFFEINQVR